MKYNTTYRKIQLEVLDYQDPHPSTRTGAEAITARYYALKRAMLNPPYGPGSVNPHPHLSLLENSAENPQTPNDA